MPLGFVLRAIFGTTYYWSYQNVITQVFNYFFSEVIVTGISYFFVRVIAAVFKCNFL